MKTKLIALTFLTFGLCSLLRAAEKVVDDRVVCAWILSSLNLPYNAKDSADVLAKRLDHYIAPEVVEQGWGRLKYTRDKNRTLELELAAAEHYLYARLEASNSGDKSYLRIPEIYATAKKYAFEYHLQWLLQQTDQPLSPPNASVVNWGVQGAERGLKDYASRTGKAPTTSYESISEIVSSFLFYYARYMPSPVVSPVATPVISN